METINYTLAAKDPSIGLRFRSTDSESGDPPALPPTVRSHLQKSATGSEKETGADEKHDHLDLGQISLAMIWKEYMIVNVELEAEADNDDDTLARFELLELILRIASLKYIRTRKVKSKKNRWVSKERDGKGRERL